MGYEFNADEIFQMAEQIEINGESFYREMSKKISDSSVRETLLDLAAMESEHRKVFASMRAELSGGKDRQPSSTLKENQPSTFAPWLTSGSSTKRREEISICPRAWKKRRRLQGSCGPQAGGKRNQSCFIRA
ncbi:MAG: hypothetical protein JRH06_11610 [Deltaproteobacteria bacterium]|nr:hypothetical protein [Deltaproteobacteria bacterium]